MENNSEQMTTFKKCQIIRNSLLTRIGESLSYSEWTDESKINNINGIYSSLEKWEKEGAGSFKINPNDLTTKECEDLGFAKWSNENAIQLIPLWLFPFLAEEFEFTSIGGSKHNKLSELDSDHRYGCLAYGIIPKDSVQVSSQTSL